MSMDKVFDALKLTPGEKKVFNYLMEHDKCISFEIQKEELMQQPEVSMAIKELKNKKFIQSEIIINPSGKKFGKRYVPAYSLTKDVFKIMVNQLIALNADLLDKADLYASLIEELVAMKKLQETVTTHEASEESD